MVVPPAEHPGDDAVTGTGAAAGAGTTAPAGSDAAAPAGSDPDAGAEGGTGSGAQAAGGGTPDRRLPRRGRLRRVVRRGGVAGLAVLGCVLLLAAGTWGSLAVAGAGTPARSAGGSGHDALWLGHAWVDGRKGQSDVDALAARLRGTGIRDLFVHAGPLRNDGSLDPALCPRAGWFVAAVHAALPGVRVQAWLGARPSANELQLTSPATRARVVASAGQVLDDGFDGVQYDFEPVADGDRDLLAVLRDTHRLTGQRHAVLSVCASHTQPYPGMATAVRLLPGTLTVWSEGYLGQVAAEADQVALMAYDTALPDQASYRGYLRRVTELAMAAVPADVTLLVGVPAYHDTRWYRHADAETVAAAVRGVRLAMGAHPAHRDLGVALYVDFAATEDDWAAYRDGWLTAGSTG